MIQKVTLQELPYFVRNVLAVIGMQSLDAAQGKATIVALRGELGAGKTTFTQALARELGIAEPLQSPTYVLMKSYPIAFTNPFPGIEGRFDRLVHIDAYRLNSAKEFAALKPEQFLQDPKALVVVEWPEKVGAALPEPDITVVFSSENAAEGERFVEMQSGGQE